MKSSRVSDVENISITSISDKSANILVLEEKELPLRKFERTFVVTCSKGLLRGNHAHLECTQMMVCILGSVKVQVDDSFSQARYSLNKGSVLLIPPGIWSTQDYLEERNILAVLCDKLFVEEDYLRNYDDFIVYKE